MEETKTANISLGTERRRRLIEQAKREERPISWVVCKAIDQYLDRQGADQSHRLVDSQPHYTTSESNG